MGFMTPINKYWQLQKAANRVSYELSTCKFRASCRDTLNGTLRYLGLFDSPEAAHEAWLRHKLALADKLKSEIDAIDHRIYPNVVTIM